MANSGSIITRRVRARRLGVLSGALSAATLAFAGAAMAAEIEYTAPFARSSGSAAGERLAVNDHCGGPVYAVWETWGECGGSWTADKQSGRITASSWIRRTAENTGGNFGAWGYGSVGIDHALARPAAGVTVTAIVEVNSGRGAWVQDDVVNQTSSAFPDSSRADVVVDLWVSHSCRCKRGGTSHVPLAGGVNSPNTESLGAPGRYRLKKTLHALDGETLEAGDLRVWITAKASNFSFADPMGALVSTIAKDTGKFRSDVDVVVRKINVAVE